MNKTQARKLVRLGQEVSINGVTIALASLCYLSEYELKRVKYPAGRLLLDRPYVVIIESCGTGLGMSYKTQYFIEQFQAFEDAWKFANHSH